MATTSDVPTTQPSFVTALAETSIQEGVFIDGTRNLGENGCPQYSDNGVDDPRVALFNALVRKCEFYRVNSFVMEIIKLWKEKNDIQILVDLFVLPFQTRAIRGPGKGERDLFYFMLISLNMHFPLIVNQLLENIPFYGSFKDYVRLMEVIEEQQNGSCMYDRCIELIANHLMEDNKAYDNAISNGTTPQISLCAKWAPREGKHFDKKLQIVSKLCAKMFPECYIGSTKMHRQVHMLYRKMVSKLSKALDVTEIYMTAKKWAEINFHKVPSRCLKINRKGFLNEALKKVIGYDEFEKGNRFPTDEDRVECRKHLIEFMKNPENVKSGTVFPHEIIHDFWNEGGKNHELTTTEKMLLEIAFNNIVSTTRDTIEKAKEDKPPTVDMTNMIDVSGSMFGTPIEVAIALGIITGELVNDNYKKKGITFSAHPTFIDWSKCSNLEEIVELMKNANWGMNTDFELAMDLIIKTAREHHLTRDQIPNLLVLSDMQFDVASRSTDSWTVMHERIVRKFNNLGMELEGVKWDAPLIFYWNLRGDTTGTPVNSNTEGTAMLSGFSPSLLQLILSGDFPVEVIDPDDPEQKVKIMVTPYDMFRKAVDHEFYNVIRQKLSEMDQYPFENYHM